MKVSKLPLILGLILTLLAQSIYAQETFLPAKVRDISDRAYEKAVIGLLDGAKESIVISMYDVTIGKSEQNPTQLLLNDLLEARQRGVEVVIYLNTDFRKRDITSKKLFKNINLKKLQEAGCVIHLMPSSPRLHDKLIIVDSRYVIEGSVNWSISALKSNFESATLIDSPELAKVKLSRLKRMPLEPRAKKPPKPHYLDKLPKNINIPKAIIEDKEHFPQMLTRQDGRSMDLYLLLLGYSQDSGKHEFFIDLADMAVSLGMPDSWSNDTLRRQVIKSLKKLEERYNLIHINFSHSRDAWVELADIKGGIFPVSTIIINPKKKPSQRLKFLLLIKALLEASGEDIYSIPKKDLAGRFHVHYCTIKEAFKELQKCKKNLSKKKGTYRG